MYIYVYGIIKLPLLRAEKNKIHWWSAIGRRVRIWHQNFCISCSILWLYKWAKKLLFFDVMSINFQCKKNKIFYFIFHCPFLSYLIWVCRPRFHEGKTIMRHFDPFFVWIVTDLLIWRLSWAGLLSFGWTRTKHRELLNNIFESPSWSNTEINLSFFFEMRNQS